MKKLHLLFYIFLALAVITGCEKEDDDDDDNDNNTFSELTVEENKQKLEDDGLEMLDKMKDMENSDAIEVIAAMVHFMDLADPFEGNPDIDKKKGIISYFKPLVAVGQMHELGYKPVVYSLKSINEDPESIQEAYDMLVGVYSWNSGTEVWDYEKTGDAIEFKFPSTETGTSNNANAKAHDYSGYTGTIGYDLEDYEGDLPESIKVALNADGTDLLNFEFSASYTNNGEPTDVSSSLSFSGYSLSASVYNHNNTEAGMETEFKDGSETIIKISVDGKGDWSAENIDENTYMEYDTTYDFEGNVLWVDEWTEINGEKIFHEGNALFQAMNTKITGDADVKTLFEKEKEIYANDDDEGFDDDAATLAMVDVINENIDLKVRYADNNEIIAVAEAYAYDDTYTDYVWNETTQQYDEVTITEKEIDLRFKFSDGSTVDAETYFDTGFDDLFNEFEAWIESLEAEWDL